ncbi:MAG: stress response serine/threonine protein kinase YihE [Burkholderiales bacterium PBB6]|nr:MAG: stress response serine/threonine protein kinase YihE [Burkholderiales bacterium PBB6]
MPTASDHAPTLAPYASLDPQAVLEALYAAGFDADGRLLQLNSYENRVWMAHLEDGSAVVAKFYRPNRWTDAQIAEEHALTAELAEADLPVVTPLALQPRTPDLVLCTPTLGRFTTPDGGTFRLAVTERRVGHAPELEHPETLARLGRLLGRVHAVGRRGRFEHRRTLNSQTYGHAARQRLLDSGTVHADTESSWLRASAQALELIDQLTARLDGVRSFRLHGDCHPGNLLWRDEGQHSGPNLVDFDDCCTGPAVQDLWMLLPGEREATDAALHHLLDGYRDFTPFDDRELLLIEPLRTLRMIHHSAWIAERWSDPAFPIGFPWFDSPSYWQQQATELNEQVERMRDLLG